MKLVFHKKKMKLNIDEPLNINFEIKNINLADSNIINLKDNKLIESSENYEKVVSNTANNFYRPNKNINNIRGNKIFLSHSDKKESNLTNENIEQKKIEFSQNFKRVPSLSLLPNYKVPPQKKIILNKKEN